MNLHMKTQINTMLTSADVFLKTLELAATKDDGEISAEERKIIRKAKKATEKYKKMLNKIKD